MARAMVRAKLRGAVCGMALALLPVAVGAEGWAGFYTPTQPDPKPVSAPAPDRAGIPDSCVGAIRAAEARYRIPGNLLLAIGLQEAGLKRGGRLTVWPWSVNADGDGRMFATADAALKWVRAQQASGTNSIDVGCMQVNLRWHPDAFASLEEAFDPARNVDYAARFLVDLYNRTGDWMKAAGSYHSMNEAERAVYLSSLNRNLAVANAGVDAGPGMPPLPGRPAPRPVELAAAKPQPGIAWSAALSAGKDSAHLSIYSTQDLQPVLPNFRQEF